MGDSSSTSNNGMPLADEIQVCGTSCLPLDCIDRSRISTGRMDGRSLPSSVEDSIEKSKCHWSQVREFDCDEEVEVSNVELFQTLQRHPTWGDFFMSFGDGEGSCGALAMGEKFAEGGQAELYDVQIEWLSEKMREQDLRDKSSWALKVFKKGTSLQYLQAQWPQGMLQFNAQYQVHVNNGLPRLVRFYSDVFGGTLLKDGRFAFLLVKEQEDLRSWIDRQRSGRNDISLLSRVVAMKAMYDVALGMNQLHDRNIVHRDLKASNVLVSWNYNFNVADYECSIGVVGTGFFRAPEILQACKDRTVSSKVELFTKAADVYSYGMICYEIWTGKLPFEGHPLNDYDLVIKGVRPEVPQYVDGWICKLLNRCWHPNPASRPSFKEILQVLVANSSICLARKFHFQMREVTRGTHIDVEGIWMLLEKIRLMRLKLLIQLRYRLGRARLRHLKRM